MTWNPRKKQVPYETAPSWTILEKNGSASHAHRKLAKYGEVLGIPTISMSLMLPPPRDVAMYHPDIPEIATVRKVLAVCTYDEGSYRGKTWYCITLIRADEPKT
jgi:hypothetical protein